MVPARQHPKLALIETQFTEDGVVLTAPGLPPLNLKFSNAGKPVVKVTLFLSSANRDPSLFRRRLQSERRERRERESSNVEN
jgi:hypothetical protein